MPCILTFCGSHFNVDGFINASGLIDGTVSRRGTIATRIYESWLVRTIYGLTVSDADFKEFDKQVTDVTKYLSDNFDSLSLWRDFGVDLIPSLDFGYETRMHNVWTQVEILPADFISLAGSLGFRILLSQYQPSDKDEELAP